MSDERLAKATRELMSWWTSETQEFRDLVIDLLSGLPGSDELVDSLGLDDSTKNNCGWKEIDMLGRLFMAVNNKEDVEEASKAILKIEKEQEE